MASLFRTKALKSIPLYRKRAFNIDGGIYLEDNLVEDYEVTLVGFKHEEMDNRTVQSEKILEEYKAANIGHKPSAIEEEDNNNVYQPQFGDVVGIL